MEQQLYSVYDEITENYMFPFSAHNANDAMRMFYNASLTPNSTLNLSPQDYTLYHVATYNSNNAQYTNITPPKQISKLQSLINQNNLISNQEAQ
ncbi:MAG: nonstructural protein [Microvirus sp.]|nr:MAG: nonstructural protein [Microvirus sp.]